MLVLVAAAAYSGSLLPWDQVALWAVSAEGRWPRWGYRALFDDDVRWWLVDDRTVSPASMIRRLSVHTVVLGPASVALGALAWRGTRPPTRGSRRGGGGEAVGEDGLVLET